VIATRRIASANWQDVRETLSPRAAAREDGLPPLLIVLTIVTGVVDALAYLRLGHSLAMGVQNATARRLSVTDLTTTVLTLTLTGIAADPWLGGGTGAKTARRVLAVGAMVLGAFTGALLLLQLSPVAPLALAVALLALVAAAARDQRPSALSTG
jgi:uncharacterized membrane protein YoaK (UPF0700 family)